MPETEQNTTDTSTEQTTDATAAPGTGGEQGAASAAAAATEAAATAESVDQLPEWAQREIRKARDEAAANRVKGNEKAKTAAEEAAAKAREELLRTVGKSLGLPGFEDEQVDPNKLVEQLTAERDQASEKAAADAKALRDYQVRDAVREAATGKANFTALYDSHSFLTTINDLDPAASDFPAQVAAAIDAALEANPLLKAVAPAATQSSGSEHTGDSQSAETAPSGIEGFRKKYRENRR